METINRDSLYYTFLEILRLHHIKAHRRLEEIGLYPGQPPLLFILSKIEGQSQKELAKKLHIKASTINVMIRRMEKEGLIQRKKDEKDQRISRVYITDEGRKTCKQANEMMEKMEDDMFLNVSSDEKIIMEKLFLQIKNNLSI